MLISAHCDLACAYKEVAILVKKNNARRDFKNRVFEPLDLSDHHQNLYTCSEREYCIPTNFHRDRTTPAQFFKDLRFLV